MGQRMKPSLIWLGLAAAVAAASPALAQTGSRNGAGSCRQSALALIAMLDAGDDTSAGYRDAYGGVVQSCGPAPRKAAVMADRAGCRDLALKLLDEIEQGRLDSQRLARARDAFAASCAPR